MLFLLQNTKSKHLKNPLQVRIAEKGQHFEILCNGLYYHPTLYEFYFHIFHDTSRISKPLLSNNINNFYPPFGRVMAVPGAPLLNRWNFFVIHKHQKKKKETDILSSCGTAQSSVVKNLHPWNWSGRCSTLWVLTLLINFLHRNSPKDWPLFNKVVGLG